VIPGHRPFEQRSSLKTWLFDPVNCALARREEIGDPVREHRVAREERRRSPSDFDACAAGGPMEHRLALGPTPNSAHSTRTLATIDTRSTTGARQREVLTMRVCSVWSRRSLRPRWK